jgi:hypothetical protein
MFMAHFVDEPNKSEVKMDMPTNVSSKDVGKWNELSKGVQVQASHRQRGSDPEWYIPDSDWKIQIWYETIDVYISSYINNEQYEWTTTVFENGNELHRQIWYF